MTANQIDSMPIEELESLACNLTPNQLFQWSASGYERINLCKTKTR